jgi:hypothetical protein
VSKLWVGPAAVCFPSASTRQPQSVSHPVLSVARWLRSRVIPCRTAGENIHNHHSRRAGPNRWARWGPECPLDVTYPFLAVFSRRTYDEDSALVTEVSSNLVHYIHQGTPRPTMMSRPVYRSPSWQRNRQLQARTRALFTGSTIQNLPHRWVYRHTPSHWQSSAP